MGYYSMVFNVCFIFFFMSSLAAVQADGYYYPPNWDPAEWNKEKARHVDSFDSLGLSVDRTIGKSSEDIKEWSCFGPF